MVEAMQPGSVIVDLAVERGGNVEGAKPGEVVTAPGRHDRRLPQRARPHRGDRLGLYARNLYAFVETLIDKDDKTLAVNWDDELVKATASPATAPWCIPPSGPLPPRPPPRRPSRRRVTSRFTRPPAPR